MSAGSLIALGGIGLSLAGFLVWLLVRRYGGAREAAGRLAAVLEVRTQDAKQSKRRADALAGRSYTRDELIRHGLRKARAESFRDGAVPADEHRDVEGSGRDPQ